MQVTFNWVTIILAVIVSQSFFATGLLLFSRENRVSKVTEVTVTASHKGPGIYEERTVLPDGTIRFINQTDGNDNHKPAIFRFTYLMNAGSFSRKKEVCYKGESQWFMRNELVLKAK